MLENCKIDRKSFKKDARKIGNNLKNHKHDQVI